MQMKITRYQSDAAHPAERIAETQALLAAHPELLDWPGREAAIKEVMGLSWQYRRELVETWPDDDLAAMIIGPRCHAAFEREPHRRGTDRTPVRFDIHVVD